MTTGMSPDDGRREAQRRFGNLDGHRRQIAAMSVRIALGARSLDVIGLIVRDGLRVVIPGVLLGTVVSIASGKWIAPLLFQVSPNDSRVLLSVVATLIAVALAASWIPARRASRADPNVSLRAD